jgi:hypothetical protein
MRNYLHYFQYVPDGRFDTLHATIAAAPSWIVVYQDRDISIYKFIPPKQ